jgi:hypothetical protein
MFSKKTPKASHSTVVIAFAFSGVLAGCVMQPLDYQSADSAPPEQYDTAEQITEPPPPLPVYDQPPCPEPDYIWTPGLWQWGPAGYFWVPGTWVAPPEPGLLWTPGYWGLASGVYLFHAGYWGPHVGFYGGINYGFGYTGEGYWGGRWRGNRFDYNTAVSHVNVNIVHNTYNETIINNVNIRGEAGPNRASYAGGPGTRLQANAGEIEAARDAHVPPTADQVQHQMMARSNPELGARHNEGHPTIAATERARDFGGGVVAARPVGPAYQPTVAPTARTPHYNPFVHAGEMPTRQTEGVWGTGASEQQQAYARQRNDLLARQEQERQTLAHQQQLEHQNFASQPVHDHPAYEAMEQQHWQQTSQMQQRHQQESQQFSRGAPPRSAPNPRR